ncbi:MAG: M17 family peptidase N-terminal domain-containing protein [Myxococcaceae bacterium]
MNTLPLALETLDKHLGADALLLFIGEDERPLQGLSGMVDWRMCGRLSRLLQENFFQGSAGETLLLPSMGRIDAPRIFVMGVGPLASLTSPGVEHLLARGVEVLQKAKISSVALEPPGAPTLDDLSRFSLLEKIFAQRFSPGKTLAFVEPRPERRASGARPSGPV